MGGSAAGTRLVVSTRQDADAAMAWAGSAGIEATPLAEDRGRPVLRLAGPEPVPALIRALAAQGVSIEEVGPLRQSLEELFLALAEHP